MTRRLLPIVVLAALAACHSSETTQSSSTPSYLISDATHSSGNPDFFFLPPMVPNPSGSPNWNAGQFDGTLQPTVEICALAATSEAQVTLGAACGATTIYSFGTGSSSVRVEPGDEQYIVNWKVPSSAVTFYRIKVKVGPTLLGFADVETGAKPQEIKNVDNGLFVPLKDGTTLPIKFRIERCNGTTPCAVGIVNLAEGGTVDLNGNGVTIPAQGGPDKQETITVTGCPNLPVDLPLFGQCLRITAVPALPPSGLTNAATVYICSVTTAIPAGMDHNQQERITLHRKDGSSVFALPHAAACGFSLVERGSFKGLLHELVHANWKGAGRQLGALLSPTPLYARRLDQGGGGQSDAFSDFQFALPSKLRIISGDFQIGAPGSALPDPAKVQVTDLKDLPVAGATVHFVPANGGSVGSASFVTGTDGFAQTTWTLGSGAGAQTLKAQGIGLAGTDLDGPRSGECTVSFDPFQPIQPAFPGCPGNPLSSGNITLQTGSVTFNATAFSGPVNGFGFLSGGYTYLTGVAGDSHITWDGTPHPTPGSAVPAGWYSPGFDTSGWTANGMGGFGGIYAPCTLTSAANVKTTWATNSDILVRKLFATTGPGTVTVLMPIDNDGQVWLDGSNITASTADFDSQNKVQNGGNADPSDDWFAHGNCAETNVPLFSAHVGGGIHTLAIRGHDWGTVAYLDAKVTFTPDP